MAYARPESLVETDWLAEHLDDPDLRIFDCTTHLIPDPDTVFKVESGLADYLAGHIPGAGYLDLQADLSDPAGQFRFTTPGADAFAKTLAAKGLGDGRRVVLYSTTAMHWATRIWWMLHAFGIENAAILNGGWQKWRAEDRPVSTDPRQYPAAKLTARRRPGLIVLGVGQVRTSGLRGDMVTNIEEMTESVRASLKEAELMAGVGVDRVYVGIGGDHVRATSSMGVVAVSEDDVTADDIERGHVVARAVALPPDREMLHAIPQEYRVDRQRGIKDPLGMAGVRLSYAEDDQARPARIPHDLADHGACLGGPDIESRYEVGTHLGHHHFVTVTFRWCGGPPLGPQIAGL